MIIAKKIRFEAEMRRLPSLNLADEKSHSASDDGSFLERLPHILCYPTDKCLVASINASRDIHINKTRLLEIELQTGRNIVQRGQLNLRAASAGLRLITAEAIIADEAVGLTKGKEPGTLDLANLDANSSITISLPYDLESNLSQITISLDFRYTTSAGTFQYLSNPSILVDLALDVNVHDLFRDDVLFSRFQIRASRGIPLLVSSVQLSDTNRYAVEAPPCELTPMLVLPRQDGIMLYKIKPKGQGRIERQSVKIEEPLQLSVKYLLLDESVLAVMQQSLLQALDHSSFGHLKFLLRNALAQLSRSLSHGSLEELALLNEFHLPDYEVMGWSELLDGLQPSVRQELATWLRQWHKQNRVLSLAANKGRDESTSLQRLHTIKIDVPLPRLQILHTASLSLPSKGFVSQGSVLTANVSVYHTRRWETRSSTVPTMSSRGQELDFSLEVDAPPDVWLLGGDRRTSFVSLEAEVKTFELLLVPLKTGRLLLPEVIVRWNGQSEEEVRCETDFRSAGETVVVAADVKSTSVGLNEMVTGTEIMLMASERRR